MGQEVKIEKEVIFRKNENIELLDESLVLEFLEHGMPEELEAFVQKYICNMGMVNMDSMLLRYYIVMKVNIAVLEFMNKRVSVEKFHQVFPDFGDLQRCSNSSQEAVAYLRKTMMTALMLRDSKIEK